MVSVRDGGLVLPFTASMPARVLAVAGLPTVRALDSPGEWVRRSSRPLVRWSSSTTCGRRPVVDSRAAAPLVRTIGGASGVGIEVVLSTDLEKAFSITASS